MNITKLLESYKLIITISEKSSESVFPYLENAKKMASKRNGHLTVTKEWAMHLRKYTKRRFWKGERKAGKNLIRKAISNKE